MVMIYLKRGQPEHAIRALFNGFAQNIYRDVRCFIEHPVEAFGLGAGPFYKTPDENCWINWLRNCLLMEKGDDLLAIAPGAPRSWFADGFSVEGMATYFGPVGYSVIPDGNRIVVRLDPPRRNPPKTLEVHLRHPERKALREVTVNGRPHSDFDAESGVVRFTDPGGLPKKVGIVAGY
jgi:hypothetical protein